MAHIKFKFDTLNAFCNEAFEKFGFSKEESTSLADALKKATSTLDLLFDMKCFFHPISLLLHFLHLLV